MRHLLVSTAALAALVFAAPAFAESGGAAEALSFTWTGLYGGVNVGYGWGNSDWDFTPSGSTSTNDNGGVVGLQFGYDMQVGDNLFAGIEASLDASDIDGKSGCGANHCETQNNSLADISARLGIANGRALYYGKAGLRLMKTPPIRFLAPMTITVAKSSAT